MTISEALRATAPKLQPKHIVCDEDRDLGVFEAQLLLAHVLKKDRVFLIANSQEKLSAAVSKKFHQLIARRVKHEPIAHIFGEKDFYGRTFIVNKHTLIPRPETEQMIDLVRAHAMRPPTTIWDIGTGSGAIAITLAKEISDATILASDVSTRALLIAKKNAKLHQVTKRISFLKSNLLQKNSYRWLQKHSGNLLICANLPYLPVSDKQKLELDVMKFEPASALFSGTDGLTLITRFLAQLSRHIPEWSFANVTLFFEFDPPQVKKISALAKKYFPAANIEIKNDLANRPRILIIQL